MSTMNKDKYISIQELADLKGVSTRAIRMSRDKYITREIIVRGGKSFEILLSSIELDLQEKYFEQKPKIAKMRRFYDIPVYFYLYNDELFVADKPLKTKRKKLPHTKEESLRIKVLYSRLRRSINHSQMKQNLAQHVAEHIWRYGNLFEYLINQISQ